MRYEALPPELRAQVDAQVGRRAARTTRKASTEVGLALTCTRCPTVLQPATDGAMARHQEATGHGHFQWKP